MRLLRRCAPRNDGQLVRGVRRAHHSASQSGYILLPVVLLITLVSVIAFMLNNETALDGGATASVAESAEVRHIAEAGLAHAAWGVQNAGCRGDMAMPGVPFAGGSYTATVDAGGVSSTTATFTADRDTWINESSPDDATGGVDSTLGIVQNPGNSMRALYHFDLSSIPPGDRVVSATAGFFVDTNDDSGVISLHAVTADWTEADASWNTIGASFGIQAHGIIPPQPDKNVTVTVNLTALAQSWVNAPASNHGVLLQTASDQQTRLTSREEGTASQRPWLQVTTASGQVSPVTLGATGTLAGNPSPANDITRNLTRTAVPAYQPPGTVFLQLGTDPGEDAMPDSFYELRNYGGATYLQVHDNGSDWQQYPLLRFDLAGLPQGAAVRSARLELNQQSLNAPGTATIHQVTRSWVEGTKSGGGVADGATWFTHDGTNAWTSAGGDINASVVAETAINGGETWVSWEIAPLVERWLAGEPNHGLQIRPANGLEQAKFASKEDATVGVQPKLTITYACECGSPCLAPQGSGTVGMVVVNPTTPVPADAYKKSLFESWGYTVNLIGENSNNADYLAAAASNDVFFISETANVGQVGNRIRDVPIGVVSQDGDYTSQLGFAENSAWPVGSGINVTDTSHYITAPFPSGPLDIYAAAMEQVTISGPEAAGLQVLADTGGAGSLVVLEQGAVMGGDVVGDIAAGHRVMLPLGREGKFNWDYLNSNGQLLVQRALQWGTGNTGSAPAKQLLFVAQSTTPTAQEQLRIDLIESWGYGVNVIDDNDSQANFDVAVTANDVAYVSSTVSDAALGTKLKAAPIGLVNEQGALVEEFGFGIQNVNYKSRIEIDVLDNTHYITTPFPTGLLTVLTGNQALLIMTATTAPGFDALAQVFNTGSLWDDSLGVIDIGGDLYGGGTAAGRRVQLPWGDATFDVTSLNADGQTLMQRAIEWAEGAGAAPAPAYNVLMIVGNLTLSSKDIGYKALIESWGHTVSLIDDGDSQANYDTAMAAADVILASGSAIGSSILDKPTNTTKGLVNEVNGKIDNFGFSSSTAATANFDTFSTTNAAHYITEPFAGNPVTVFTTSLTNPVPGGTLAPDMSNVAEDSGTLVLGTLDIGATRYDGNPSQGRRAHLPFASAEVVDMTADGEMILQRTLEWAAGASGVTYTVLLVVSDPASLTEAAADRKTLMESWGYTVNLIDDDDTAVNFVTAINAADVIYVGAGTTATASVMKMLMDISKGVVNEPSLLVSDAGFASSVNVAFAVDKLTIVDSTHSITQGFASPVTVFTALAVPTVLSGTLSPDLQNLGEFLAAPAVAVLESGAARHDAGITPGRRAQLPFEAALGSDLTADGQLIVRRAIEWAAGAGSGGGGGGGGGGGVVFEEFAEVNPSTTYNVNVPTPGSTVAGDLLIAAIASDEDASDLTAPAGWNAIAVVNNGTRVTLGVWWKIAGASEPASHTFTSSSYNMKYGWMMRFSGHDPASPINATSTFDTGSSKNPPVASATTTVADTLVLRIGGFDHEDITVDDPGLTGHTPITMDLGGSGLGACAGGAGYTYLPSAGATGTTSFALTAREEYVTGTIAIAPAP